VRVITLRLPPSLLEKLSRAMMDTGKTRSELIREALEWYLDIVARNQSQGLGPRYKRVVLRC